MSPRSGIGALFIRRSWILALLALVAGLSAWFLSDRQQPLYERTLSFVLRPGTALDDGQVPDATRGLSQDSGQVGNTIAGVLGSAEFLARAARAADVESVGAYTSASSIRPGSDIIDVRFRGPDEAALADIGGRYSEDARAWVEGTYRAYELEELGSSSSGGPISPKPLRDAFLAAFFGVLLGCGAVLAEHRARRAHTDERDRSRTRDRNVHNFVTVDDLTGRTDRLERALRSYLEDGEQVVRVSPNRLGIVREPRAESSAKR